MASQATAKSLKQKFGIQVVEKDTLLSKKICNILSSTFRNALILSAADRDECLAQLTKHPIDVTIMDIRLKAQHGLLLVSEIKTLAPTCFIIIHSMYDSHEYQRAAKAYGADEFLSKNHNSIADMISLIEVVCDRPQARAVSPQASPRHT
jgi:DNA-binding NarL/FixJ family response regulator